MSAFTRIPVESVYLSDALPFDRDGRLITDPDRLAAALDGGTAVWKTVEDRWNPENLTERVWFDDATTVDIFRADEVLVRLPLA